MVTVSLCMIVRNEEDVLARCLETAASLVDEIVIVDTGSADRTREIAERLPAASTLLIGLRTSPRPEITPFLWQKWIIVCGWMRTT